MLPLIKMAWVLNRRLLFQGSPIFAMYLAQLVVILHKGDVAPFIIIALFITYLSTAIVTLQGLTLPVEGFLLALPISRTQVVKAKYATSLMGLTIEGVVNPRLTWTDKLAVFRKDAAIKPFVWQVEQDPITSVLAEGSDEEVKNKRWLFAIDASYNTGLNQWRGAQQIQFT